MCCNPEWLYDVGSTMAYAVILPGRGVSNVDVFAVLCPLFFGLWCCSSLLGFLRVRPVGGGGRRVAPLPPSVLRCVPRHVPPAFLLEFLHLALWLGPVPARGGLRCCPGPPRVLRSCVLSSRSSSIVFLPISTRFRIFGSVFAAFSVLRGARQVERFAECSF